MKKAPLVMKNIKSIWIEFSSLERAKWYEKLEITFYHYFLQVEQLIYSWVKMVFFLKQNYFVFSMLSKYYKRFIRCFFRRRICSSCSFVFFKGGEIQASSSGFFLKCVKSKGKKVRKWMEFHELETSRFWVYISLVMLY